MPAGDAWLGLDLGTQSARAVAVSSDGRVLAAAAEPIAGRRDGPRHEQDPEDWWDALTRACRDTLSRLPASAVGAAALCGTSGTILLVDEHGEALTPGVMYDDTRAVEEAVRANQAGGDRWSALGYSRMQPSWALPKLLWLLDDAGGGTRPRLAHQADFITRRLAGTAVPADSSHALKTGYDAIAEEWPLDVFADLGIPGDVLPDVVRSGRPLGTVCRAAAEATGIPAGTALYAGMTDGCAAQLASGALRPGSWNSVLGTTLVVKGVSRELLRDPSGVVYSHRSPDGGWLPGGASSTGAGVLALHYAGRDLQALDRAASTREPSSVVAYPLAARGERFPFMAPEAHGFVLGAPADESDHYAALLQGVAFVERLVFDYLDHLGAPVDGCVTLTGGAARSRYWSQLRADVLGRSVRIPESAEAAVGMAVLAAAGATSRSLADTAADMVRIDQELAPREDRVGRFREPYVRLVGELEACGWLDAAVADHARRRAAQ